MPKRFEVLEKVDTLVVDKTGTLTEGKPRVMSVSAASGLRRMNYCAWRPAWSREVSTRSAAAIVSAAKNARIALARPRSFSRALGAASWGRADGSRFSLAISGYFKRAEFPSRVTQRSRRAAPRWPNGNLRRYRWQPAGLIGISDPIKAFGAAGLCGISRPKACVW